MADVGRNQPCPCGSGKKYKACCLAVHDAARLAAQDERLRQTQELFQAAGAIAASEAHADDAPDRLDELSNGSLDLIRSGHLGEAERMCQLLLAEYPDMIDGHMRLGHLYRIRGDAKKAAEHMRTAAAMARTPDYDPEVASGLDAEADKLDPPSS